MSRIVIIISLMFAAVVGCQDSNKPKKPPEPTAKEKVTEQWNTARAAVQFSLATQQFQSGDFDSARRSIDQALLLNAKHAPSHILSAKLSIEKGDLAAAEKSLDTARKLDPKLSEADYLAGIIYQRWEKPDKALESYVHASEKDSENLSYLIARAEMLVVLNRQSEALALLQDKVIHFESSPAIRDAVGQLLQQQGKAAEASDYFRKATFLAPDDLSIRERYALALYDSKQWQDAADVINRLIKEETYAHRADLLAALGECQLQLGDSRNAVSSFELAAQIKPSVVGIWLGLAESSLKCNDPRRTELALRKAQSLDPDNVQIQLLTGDLRLHQKRYSEALFAFTQAHALDPADPLSLCMIGYSHEKMGQSGEALRFYAQALKLKPDDQLAGRLMASLDSHN